MKRNLRPGPIASCASTLVRPPERHIIWPPPDLPYFFSQGRFLQTDAGAADIAVHRFGHSRDIEVRSKLRKPHRLHLVLDLDLADRRLGIPAVGFTRLPLLYPFRHDGGSARYRVVSDGVIELLDIQGRISDDWPYEEYPERFGTSGFALTEPVPCTPEEFERPMLQGLNDEHRGQFIAVVPDRKLENSWGLWTDSGGECINVVFAFDRKTRIVETYNETD